MLDSNETVNSTPSTSIGSDEGTEEPLIAWSCISIGVRFSRNITCHHCAVCPGHNGPESKETLLTEDTSNTDKIRTRD